MCTTSNNVRIVHREEENYIRTSGKGELWVFLKFDQVLSYNLIFYYFVYTKVSASVYHGLRSAGLGHRLCTPLTSHLTFPACLSLAAGSLRGASLSLSTMKKNELVKKSCALFGVKTGSAFFIPAHHGTS